MENSHTINNSKNSIPNVKCECETIDWCNYHIHNDNCKSCYCKWIREEISYEIYENICILSRKNSGRKFKELCMIAT
jgi:hypothetical protein